MAGQPSALRDYEYWQNADDSYETAYAWRYQRIQAPYYGAFAEGYTGPAVIAGVRVYLTTTDNTIPVERSSDFFVWGDDGGQPGLVRQVRPAVYFDTVPEWPEFGFYDVEIHTFVDGPFYVGAQPNFQEQTPYDYHFGADLNGPGGDPWICVAPNTGYPEGWQRPDVVWSETAAMGFGVYVGDFPSDVGDLPDELPGGGSQDQSTTWGAVKSLFRR